MQITIDDKTIRARKFASQIMAIIGDCVSDKDGAASRLIDAAYRTDAQITSGPIDAGSSAGSYQHQQ